MVPSSSTVDLMASVARWPARMEENPLTGCRVSVCWQQPRPAGRIGARDAGGNLRLE